MNFSDLRDVPDSAGDLASASLRYVSDVNLPDVSLPDALDIDVADLAGDALELAGDVAGTVVAQSSRGLAKAIRLARQNPEATIGIVAVIVVLVAMIAAKKKTSNDTDFSAVS